MKSRIVVDSDVDTFQFGYWDQEAGKFIPVNGRADSTQAMAERLGCTEELVATMEMLFENLRARMTADLSDIWARLP
jgi:hypothetical protein